MSTQDKEELETAIAVLRARVDSLETIVKTYGRIILVAALFGAPVAQKLISAFVPVEHAQAK